MKIIIFLLLLTSSISCKNSKINTAKSKGSFLVAAAYKDGIVVAADTRGCFYNDINGERVVYSHYEPIQKIFQVGNEYVIGLIGNITMAGNKNWHYYYLEQYLKKRKPQESMEMEARQLYSFMKTNYPDIYSHFIKSSIFFIGYEKKSPIFCIVENGRFRSTNGRYIVSDTLSNFKNLYNDKDSCKVGASMMRKLIPEFAKKYSQEDFIGGYITLIKISPDNCFTWLSEKPKKEGWRNYKEFYTDYLKGDVQMTFTSEESKKFIYKLLESNL